MAVRRVTGSFRALAGEGRGRLLASVAFGWFLVLGMRFVVPGVLPTITEGFGATGAQAGLAVTVLWITYAVMQFPAGYYADRLGERVLLVAGLSIGAGGLLTYAFTPTFGLFVVATGVFGLGTGLYGPPRGTVVSKTYDENDGAAFGAMLAAGSVGAALLPALAALAVSSVGWRVALGAAAPGMLAAAVAVWWAVPDTRAASDDGHASFAGALRAAVGAVRTRRIALAVAGSTLMLFVFQAATAFLTTYLVEVKGLSQGTAGSLLGALFVVGAAAQWTGGGLADRFGTPRVLTAIGVVGAVPLVALPLVEGLPALAAFSALIGVRMSVGPVSNAYIIDLLPDAVQGTAWGALRTGFFMVGAFGSTLVGVMADAGLFDVAFYLLAGLNVVGTVVYVFLPERP
jgi:predicted MFS family arabinose efflux permease